MKNRLAVVIVAVTLVACSQPHAKSPTETAFNTPTQNQAIAINSIYWSDGDSGRINLAHELCLQAHVPFS